MARQPTYAAALRKALDGLHQQPTDGAVVRLAYGYAVALDEAAVRLAYAEPLRIIRAAVQGTAAEDSLIRIEAALSVHSTTSDLGPKLLATLAALGLTPAARAVLAKGGQRDPGPSPLDELRQRRSARQHGAAAVDPAAG